MSPYVPGQSGYGERVRAASSLVTSVIRVLARDASLWSDDVWLVGSTPVGCGCSRNSRDDVPPVVRRLADRHDTRPDTGHQRLLFMFRCPAIFHNVRWISAAGLSGLTLWHRSRLLGRCVRSYSG